MPEGSYTALHEDRIDDMLSDLQWMTMHGTSIDPTKWEQYRQAGREMVDRGRYDLDIISLSKGNSVKSMYHYPPLARLAHAHATGMFEHYMTMPTVALDIDGRSFGLLPAGYLFMPVGGYGLRFGEKLLRTTAYMVNSSQLVLHESARKMAETHPEAIARHMTRGRDGRLADASLISTFQEGARSSMEAIALLTAEEVPGFEDPDLLYEALITQGVVEEFTRAVPMGLLGPLVFAGKYFPGLVVRLGDGRLILNPSIMAEIKQTKRAMAELDLAEWVLYWAVREGACEQAENESEQPVLPPIATSLICPAAFPHGALTRMNHATLVAYQAFEFSCKT
jgi:hypothetical protein